MASSCLPSTASFADETGMLGFFHTLERLKTNKRTGWVNQNIRKPESIADHMYRMAMMALVIPESAGPRLDISKCVMMSLVHDIAEADVGDITPEHASGVTKVQKLQLEADAMDRILSLLGHPSIASLRVKSLWEEYEQRETPEAKFVKDLDLFELAVQGVEYESSNECRTLQGFFQSTVPRILHPTVKGWATELMEQRRAAWTSRGWGADYVHVPVSDKEDSSLPAKVEQLSLNGSVPEEQVNEERAKRIPERVWGEHKDEEMA